MPNLARESKANKAARLQTVLERMEDFYGDAKPELHYRSPYELLVAVMLSAQCTDKRVNAVTEELFKTYNTPETMAALTPEELEPLIKSCGLGPSKSKNIIATSRLLLSDFGGEVPREIEVLQKLPGVGRKTANVVASVAYGVPAIAVDTHVFRVSNRIGLASAKDVTNTEKQLMALIPMDKWAKAHHWLIWHGRRICTARSPKCAECFLKDVCASAIEAERQAQKEAEKLAKKAAKAVAADTCAQNAKLV